MFIIKEGTKAKEYATLLFECRKCGCICVANEYEYDYRIADKETVVYMARCPNCKRIMAIKEKISVQQIGD